MMVVLVALSCLFFELIAANYGKASAFQNQQYEAQKVIAAHYQWLEQLSDSITTGSEFEGSLNPDKMCIRDRRISCAILTSIIRNCSTALSAICLQEKWNVSYAGMM